MKKFLALSAATSLLFTNFASYTAYAEKFVHESYVSIEKDKVDFTGVFTGGQFGSALATGDFNGDGIDDLAVSAPFASRGAKKWVGAVQVIFGGDEARSVTFVGKEDGDQFGTSLAAIDYNDDGTDDLAIGTYNATVGAIRPGRVDILFGKSTLGRQGDDFLNFKSDITLTGVSDGDGFGLSLFTMDVNNDDVDDLLVGSPFRNNRGSVYVYLGDYPQYSLNYFEIEGEQQKERFGAAISGGDIDGNGYNEIVIGAYQSSVGRIEAAGKVYVVKEKKITKELTGRIKNGWFGFDIDVADINGDGKDDLAVTSFPYNEEYARGYVSIYMGGKLQQASSINSAFEANIVGPEVHLEDINSDGMADILVGAPGIGSPLSPEEGDLYVVYGSEENASNYHLKKGDFDLVLHGENADDWFGYGVAVLDFDNDGNLDLATSARYFDVDNGVNNGKVVVLRGDEAGFGVRKKFFSAERDAVNRAELVSFVVDRMQLRSKRSEEIDYCLEYKDFCLFNFMAMSRFDSLQVDPELILYPDVMPEDEYYDAVNVATMLGLVNGFLLQEDSPFKPDFGVTRIEALKVVMLAAELLEPKYQFELEGEVEETPFADVDGDISHMWWYPRYLNLALEKEIVQANDLFRPDDPITMQELADIVERTLRVLAFNNYGEAI